MSGEPKKLLELRKLKKYFTVPGGKLKAVEDVSFTVYTGEKFGVVGESGCGKSTLGRVILQLYKQTSGSCVYYGKSVQEINPKYISAELRSLKDYQNRAGECYQKSLALDAKAQALRQSIAQYDAEGSDQDAKRADRAQKALAKIEFESKELKKDASRQLREGSRTVGSLILCRDIDKVRELFEQAEAELRKAHQDLKGYERLKNRSDNDRILLDELANTDQRIAELEKAADPDEIQQLQLEELRKTRKEIAGLKAADLEKDLRALEPELQQLKESSDAHYTEEVRLRGEAFSRYRGKDILPLTERCLDKEYQAKLDGNYETGINLSKLTAKELRSIRPDLQMVFQDPAASLDPRESIGHAVEEPFRIHTDMPPAVRRQKALELLRSVDLKPEHYYSYPNSLSGGMKQRAGIARAIALGPSFVVLDEAVSALDVSVQAQILQLLNQLQERQSLTYLFITHDLGVVKHFCDRVLVMYLGNICELAPSKELFRHPLHPYTQSLLDSVPHLEVNDRHEDRVLQGEVPNPVHPPQGCPFHTRCPKCLAVCRSEKPAYREVRPGHFAACHLLNQKEGQ